MEKLWYKIIKYNPNFHKFNLKPNKNIIIVRKVFVSLHGFILTWVFCGSCIVRRILLPPSHQGSPFISLKMLVAQWCLTVIPWTIACQAPLSMELSRQEYCSGLPSPFPGDLLDSGIEPGSTALQVDFLLSEPSGKPIHAYIHTHIHTCIQYIHLSTHKSFLRNFLRLWLSDEWSEVAQLCLTLQSRGL